ncbi:MAG: hypothetical protein ABI175_04405 [Polyangiales bacterium]
MSRTPRGATPRAPIVRLLSSALLGAALSLSVIAPSSADAPKVVVGEVSSSVGHEEVVPVMKTALSAEVAKVQPPSGKSFVVSASLTKLDTKTSGSSATTSCVISLALRDSAGNLKGMLQGTSTVSGKHGDVTAQKESVEAAIRGAAKGLPTAIAQ